MTFRIDVGISLGDPGFARLDGVIGTQVSLVDLTPGGQSFFELYYVPDADTTALASLVQDLSVAADGHTWTFTPNAEGPYRIYHRHTSGLQVFEQVLILGIPDGDGDVPAAPGERGPINATMANATDPSVVARCERNVKTTRWPGGQPWGWSSSIKATGGGNPLSTPNGANGTPSAPDGLPSNMIEISTGDGGDADVSGGAAGAAGDLVVDLGNAGTATDSGESAVDGANFIVSPGGGSSNTAAGGDGGQGGGYDLRTTGGGQGGAGGTSGAGGTGRLSTAAGRSGTATVRPSSGGLFELILGNGGDAFPGTNHDGGDAAGIEMGGGAGGAADGTGTGGSGAVQESIAGNGGQGGLAAGGTGGTGGSGYTFAGNGGGGDVGGNGGDQNIDAGNGAVGSSGNGQSGVVNLGTGNARIINTGKGDAFHRHRGGQYTPQVAITDDATIVVDTILSNRFGVVLGGNRTLTFDHAADGVHGRIAVTQSGGGNTLTPGAGVLTPGGTGLTLSVGAGAVDLLEYEVFGGATLVWVAKLAFA